MPTVRFTLRIGKRELDRLAVDECRLAPLDQGAVERAVEPVVLLTRLVEGLPVRVLGDGEDR